MYAAKTGNGGCRLFSQEMVEVTATALTLATDLRDAVDRNEVGIAVQPIVCVEDGRVHSVEILARWTHPDLGEVAPEAFFAAAERSGQVVALSLRILDQALELCREWHTTGRPLRVAVNMAPRWLADAALPEQIGLALARHAVPADLLTLEITETSVIADPRRATTVLKRLRDMGVHLSVDDFGTGYSSLTYLSRLPVDQMKIDKSFVSRMYDSHRDWAIVRSIVDLGRNLGLEVVAEGVIDPGTRRALQEMGCGLAQGYLFSPPMKSWELTSFVDSRGVLDRRPGASSSGVPLVGVLHPPELLGRPPAPREA
jgi:EAL domain-containing protein (putative c-di-GMP-specific phosphodiesterase class I)